MIFHGIVGEDQREARSPSYFNPEEAAMVVQYVQDLLDNDKGSAKKVCIHILAPKKLKLKHFFLYFRLILKKLVSFLPTGDRYRKSKT